MGWGERDHQHGGGGSLPGVASALSKCQCCIANHTTLTTPQTYSTHSYRAYDLPTATVADRVAFARTRSGLSYTALSALMDQHRDTVAASLAAPLRMRADRFIAFCSACRADPAWILSGDDPPPVLSLSGNTIGERLQAFHAQHGMSTRAMARLCGVPQSGCISAWESGKYIPLVDSLLKIADAFGISAASFLPFP